jgi:hypothetical protein
MKKISYIFVFAVSLLVSCTIKEPAAPSWDIYLNLPMINKSFLMIDLVNGDNIRVDDAEQIYYYAEGLIEDSDVQKGKIRLSPNNEGSGLKPLYEATGAISLRDGEDDDDAEIVSATIRKGTLIFWWVGVSNAREIEVVFHEIFDVSTSPEKKAVHRITNPLPNHSDRFVIDGFVIKDIDNPDAFIDELTFTINVARIDESIIPTGSLQIFYEDAIDFLKIDGIVKNLRVDANDFTTNIDIDYPDNIENAIQLNNTKIDFSIYSYIGFDCDFYGTITSYNTRTGVSSAPIYIHQRIDRVDGVLGDSQKTTFTWAQQVDQLISIAPDKIEITDTYFIIDDKKRGFIAEGLAFRGDYETTAPFDMVFTPNEPINPNTASMFTISKRNREEIEKRAKEVVIDMRLKNHFSVGANISIYLCSSDSKEDMYVDQDEFTPSFSRLVFLYNELGAGGLTNPYEKELSFVLEGERMSIFHNHEELYFGMKIDFHDGHAIIHPSERIEVISTLKAQILLDFK